MMIMHITFINQYIRAKDKKMQYAMAKRKERSSSSEGK